MFKILTYLTAAYLISPTILLMSFPTFCLLLFLFKNVLNPCGSQPTDVTGAACLALRASDKALLTSLQLNYLLCQKEALIH